MSLPSREFIKRHGRRILIYGVAPHVIIRPYYDRISRRWRAQIWAARILPNGELRWCAHIRLMYVCYTIMVHYCTRNKRDRNLYYELRICRPISEGEIDRAVNVFRHPSIRRREARHIFLRYVHNFINAVAEHLMDNLFLRFTSWVDVDSGEVGFLENSNVTDSIEIQAPIIDPPCGVSRVRRTITPRTPLYYIFRCRCFRTEVDEKYRAKRSLVEFMDQIELQTAVEKIRAAFVGERVETIDELEHFLNMLDEEYAISGNCVDATSTARWFVEYARYVLSRRFIDDVIDRMR